MADDQNKPTKKANHVDTPESYDVGYSKPPVASRFKPGESGNPQGRPKGAKNKLPPVSAHSLQDIILKEAYRGVTITEGDKRTTIPVIQAAIRSIAVSAAKGQPRAQKLFVEIVTKTEAARRQEYERTAQEFATYQLEWQEVFERYRAKGLPLPNPVPHPHDLQFDEVTGDITIIGPQTDADKAKWETLSDRLQDFEASIADAKKLLADPKNMDIKYLIEDDIAFETNICDRLRAALKGWRRRK